MITISVESDEEQWAIGTALVNGALAFGNWPFQVRRVRRLEQGNVTAVGGNGTVRGAAGGGGSASGSGGGVGIAVAGSGSGGGSASAAGGGSSATAADFRWILGRPLRSCCATMSGTGHRQGCDETGG